MIRLGWFANYFDEGLCMCMATMAVALDRNLFLAYYSSLKKTYDYAHLLSL